MTKNIILNIFFLPFLISAQNTEIQYLSGTGLHKTVKWDFLCSGGMNSGKWTKIEVPSQWELQGFGEYTYGRFYLDKEAKPSNETGIYKYQFTIPNAWKDKNISIIFGGVMTDAEVKVNNKLAGEIHQGGFYQFSYDISDKLNFSKKNTLEVKVWKESANTSVNKAERRADWWLFGGIYRPVYLEAKPRTHIQRISVDARADGKLSTDVFFNNLPAGFSLSTQIIPEGTSKPYQEQFTKLSIAQQQTIRTSWFDIKTWDPENQIYTSSNLNF